MLPPVLRVLSAWASPMAQRVITASAILTLGLVPASLFAQQTRPPRPTRPATARPSAAAADALAKAGDAVVTIVAYREGTSAVISGVGVRLPDGRVVTALRHLRGATKAEVFDAEGNLLITATTLDQAEAKLDLGVFPKVTTSSDSLVLARRSAALTNKVNLLGPRKATVRTVLERTITAVEPDENGRPVLRLGAPVPATAAGSPVVNARNELIGIAVGTLPGREDGDIAVDVNAIRELLARPVTTPFAFPTRDGVIAAAKPSADPKAPQGARATDPNAKPRTNIFPERYGVPIGADTAKTWAVELYGCAKLESRQKVYCYLRITNLERGATFQLSGGDLADSTRRKVRSAENLIVGETVQRVAGWRTKAEIPLRELESTRVALEFTPPEKEGEALRLMVDVAGGKQLWFGPFVLQRAP